MLRTIAVFLIAVCLCSVALSAPSNDRQKVRIATTAGSYGPVSFGDLGPTLQSLRDAFGADRIELTSNLHASDLEPLIREQRIDFFISTVGASRQLLPEGSRDLLTFTNHRFPDPNRSFGALFITRADSGIRSLSDMRRKTLLANHPNLYGYLVGMAEIENHGFDHKTFFRRQTFLFEHPRNVVTAILDGRADVGVISSCILEDNFPEGSPERMHIIGLNIHAADPCLRSTDQFPNWTISSVPGTDPELTREVVLTLLQMAPNADGSRWSITTDHTKTDEVLKLMKTGVYDVMKERSFEDFAEKYWIIAAIPITLLVLVGLYSILLKRMVAHRTQALQDALAAEQRLRLEADAANERYNALARVSLIGQLSSLFAHELRQPLGAIIAYVNGLKNFQTSGTLTPALNTETLNKIESQALRAEQIVERVRNYAKSQKVEKKPENIIAVVNESVSLFLSNRRFAGTLRRKFRKDDPALFATVSDFEIQIAVTNLLQNAADALSAAHTPRPCIEVDIVRAAATIEIIVEDNGPRLSQETIDQLTAPFHSTKRQGLGLGLVLVDSIVASQGGHFQLQAKPKGGLKAVIRLPYLDTASETPSQ